MKKLQQKIIVSYHRKQDRVKVMYINGIITQILKAAKLLSMEAAAGMKIVLTRNLNANTIVLMKGVSFQLYFAHARDLDLHVCMMALICRYATTIYKEKAWD